MSETAPCGLASKAGQALGAGLLSGIFATAFFFPTAVAQGETAQIAPGRPLDLLEVYEVASSLMSYQNPLFIFPGLKAEGFTVNGDGSEFNVVVKGLGLPDSSATLPEPVILHLPGLTRERDLIDVRVEGLPTSTILPEGQALKLIKPAFQGTWSVSDRGFQNFELSLERASFQGEGISHQLRDLQIRLSEDVGQGRVKLSLALKSFDADYGDSFTGTERVQGFRLSLSGPQGEIAPQTLLKLAYRLSGLALNTRVFHESLVEDPPPVASLNGLDIQLELDSDTWAQTVPPSKGHIKRVQAQMQIVPGDRPGESRIRFDGFLGATEQSLDGMSLSLQQPAALRVTLQGLEARALADLVLDQPKLGPVPGVAPFSVPLAVAAEINLQQLALRIPQLEFDLATKSLDGRLNSSPDGSGGVAGSGGQSLILRTTATDMVLRNWPEASVLNPFAKQVLLPLLPSEAKMTLAVEGLEAETARAMITSLLGLDLRGLLAAVPKDISALRFSLSDGLLRSRLLDARWSGVFQRRSGRIPLQGSFELETGPLTPLQVSMQQSLGTPIPLVTQTLSAGVLGLTLLQSFAVREEGGRLRFSIEFPETGGLPLVNGRPLPFQQFIR